MSKRLLLDPRFCGGDDTLSMRPPRHFRSVLWLDVNARPAAMASAIEPQSADSRQFQRRHGGVDADIEPQDVEFEPFVNGKQHTGEPEDRELEPGTAGCRSKQGPARQEVLADRVRRQIEAERGDLPGNKRGEGIAVGAGPEGVFVRIGVSGDG